MHTEFPSLKSLLFFFLFSVTLSSLHLSLLQVLLKVLACQSSAVNQSFMSEEQRRVGERKGTVSGKIYFLPKNKGKREILKSSFLNGLLTHAHTYKHICWRISSPGSSRCSLISSLAPSWQLPSSLMSSLLLLYLLSSVC